VKEEVKPTKFDIEAKISINKIYGSESEASAAIRPKNAPITLKKDLITP
jgi:hypothetical protein